VEPTHPACPLLPPYVAGMTGRDITQLGSERGPLFYEKSLQYAQCQWRRGLPAQAILQLNRAFAADLAPGEEILEKWPLPYAAMAYVLANAAPGEFLGNPRRHFQHYATRMSGPRAALRTWRAWACWQLTRELLPDLPADEAQLLNERIREPSVEETSAHLQALGQPGEAALWMAAMADCRR
jgi:hypothetical protein